MAKKTPPAPPTMETARTIGQRIEAARLAKGLNKAQLARALGAAWSTIHAWEEDEWPPEKKLHELSVVLGVTASYLLGEETPVKEPQYAAWSDFLRTEMGRSMTPGERRTLGSVELDASIDPSVEVYRGLLIGLRTGRGLGPP